MYRVFAALLAAGCAATPLPGETAPTLSKDVQPILRAHCAGIECHAAQFAVGKTWRNLVGVPADECKDGRLLIAPGKPGASYLIDKVEGHHLCSGVRMPKIGDPLGAQEIGTIADWIAAGARDD